MIQAEDYDIVGSYNNQRTTEIDAERSVNVFEYIDFLGKKKKSLINTSGLIDPEFVFPGATGGARAQFVFNDVEYVVFGAGIYRVTTSNTISLIGSFAATTTGYVGVDANTFQIIFVDGLNGYIWDTLANTFTQITDSSFPAKPIDVCYLDGFFIVANGDTNTFQLSSYNQGLVWGPAQNTFTADTVNNWLTIGASTIGGPANTSNYETGVSFSVTTTGSLPNPLAAGKTYYAIKVDATHIRVALSYDDAIANIPIVLTTNGTPTNTITSDGQTQLGLITSHPGTIVACRTLHRRLFLFSQNYTEVWENAGIGTNLPFRRNNSLLIEYGTPAIGSVSVSFDMMMFLSQTKDGLGSVMQVSGTQPIPISTRALDFQLSQYASTVGVSDCVGFLIKENGLIFYRMNFTEANHTFVYNVTLSNPQAEETKLWHEEETLKGDRHPAQTHAYFNGKNYVGSYNSPILYQLDPATYTNAGEAIRRMRITRPIVAPGYNRRRVDRLQVDLLQGQLNQGDEIIQEQDLLAESGLIIDTESGIDILLEQGLNLYSNANNGFLYLSISKDGGQTYGYTIKAPLGNVGQRTFRTLYRKLGTIPRGQAFVAKFEFYEALPFIVLGASWAYEVLPE